MNFGTLAWTIELYMTKYIIGEIFSSGGATLYSNPSDQTVSYNFRAIILPIWIHILCSDHSNKISTFHIFRNRKLVFLKSKNWSIIIGILDQDKNQSTWWNLPLLDSIDFKNEPFAHFFFIVQPEWEKIDMIFQKKFNFFMDILAEN